jgi:broad specificity phosphatase PhoE
MTRLLLIRHGACDPVGHSIAGRTPGIHLNRLGAQQAESLPARLAGCPIDAVFSSPMERAQQTARPLCRHLGKEIMVREALTEVDYGAWTGRRISDLADDPWWQRFNTVRSATPVPDGESFTRIQQRMVDEILFQALRYAGATLAFFSHADPLRTAIACFLGMPLDFILRIRLDTASVSIIDMHDSGFELLGLNIAGPVLIC